MFRGKHRTAAVNAFLAGIKNPQRKTDLRIHP
jgi:hypothetical protein